MRSGWRDDRLGDFLLIAATILCGLLAGLDLDRVAVTIPAWTNIGATQWAAFSRHADLENGLFLYPLEAIGATVFAAGAIGRFHFVGLERRTTWLLLYVALALSAGGLLLTTKAAPIMLSIQHLGDAAALQRAFEQFVFWGTLRAGCQIAAFVCLVGALASL